MNELSALAQAICHVKETEVKTLVKKMIEDGVPAMEILDQCHKGMGELGIRFDSGECFIPELIMAGQILQKVMDELKPLLVNADQPKKGAGCVVMGTVKNDIHNIGKDITVTMLRGSGFEVIDLGVNVPPEKYVEAIREHNPLAVGMSILITTCYKSIAETVEAIRQSGLRDKVSLMLGGAAASDLLARKTGCDFFGATAVDAVNHAAKLAQQKA
ncbi:MAG: hypothetical protein C4527_22090 [Candidatus Omnitrophota bacterium]|jgi:5-methyltetrahydrofolate--homocysteine methyltransferase|nr:MAG: hypothetical protein C4527_22090 [Candidatus Omnitrophota bacterium]